MASRWVMPLLLVSACQHIDEAAPQHLGSTPVRERNYRLNEPQYAYIGSPMVRVKDYYEIRSEQNVAVASNDFTLSPTIGFSRGGQKDSPYRIIGTTEYKGRQYRVLQMGSYGLMLDDDGTAMNTVIDLSSGLHNVFIPSFIISPVDTTFNVVSNVTADKDKRFKYYELCYSGISGNNLQMTYREYSPDNLTRPSATQDLTYPVYQAELTFRDLKLEILSSDNQQVWFMVVQDSEPAGPASPAPAPTEQF